MWYTRIHYFQKYLRRVAFRCISLLFDVLQWLNAHGIYFFRYIQMHMFRIHIDMLVSATCCIFVAFSSKVRTDKKRRRQTRIPRILFYGNKHEKSLKVCYHTFLIFKKTSKFKTGWAKWNSTKINVVFQFPWGTLEFDVFWGGGNSVPHFINSISKRVCSAACACVSIIVWKHFMTMDSFSSFCM